MENLTGKRFGKLTALEYAGKSSSGRVRWLCRCDCGNTKEVLAHSLKNGETKSCGCEHYHSKPKYDLKGLTFGRLTALEYTGKGQYLCRCSCGTEKEVQSRSLRNGKTQSCGCIQREKAKSRATKHGGYGDPLYKVLASIHQRCENPDCKDYKWYGAKGVTVCEEWALTNFPAFRDWALQAGYQPGLTIDREEPSGNYTPDNCRWITIQEQQRNRRRKEKAV